MAKLQNKPASKAPVHAQLEVVQGTELEIGDVLGSGAYGLVYKGVWRPKGRPEMEVAIKVIGKGTSQAALQELLVEATVMASVNHPHLVRLLCVSMAPSVMMVSQLVPLGSLLHFLRLRKKTLYGYNLLTYCRQIVEGMAYLEKEGLVHCDLAARNVLVQTPTEVKITDFGLARLLDVGQEHVAADDSHRLPLKWLAPETLEKRIFSHKSDVWSFGITSWEVLTFCNPPYYGVKGQAMLALLRSGQRLPQPRATSNELYAVMLQCWNGDPAKRPTFALLGRVFSNMLMAPTTYATTMADEQRSTLTAGVEPDFQKTFADLAEVDQDGYEADVAMVAVEESAYDNTLFANLQSGDPFEFSTESFAYENMAGKTDGSSQEDVTNSYDNLAGSRDNLLSGSSAAEYENTKPKRGSSKKSEKDKKPPNEYAEPNSSSEMKAAGNQSSSGPSSDGGKGVSVGQAEHYLSLEDPSSIRPEQAYMNINEGTV